MSKKQLNRTVLLAFFLLLFCTACAKPDPTQQYNEAQQLLKVGNYSAAIEILETLEDYEQSDKYLDYARMMLNIELESQAQEAAQAEAYQEAEKALNDGLYSEAIRGFKALGNYQDSTQFLEKARADSFTALLENRLTFLDTKNGNRQTTVWEYESATGDPYQYTTVDFDGDGVNELVIEYSFYGDRLILHEDDGIYYGYYRPFRGMKSLKHDGTYDYSNSAFASGVGTAFFPEGNMQEIWLLECDESISSWKFNGEEVGKKAYDAGMEVFHNTPDAEWILIKYK